MAYPFHSNRDRSMRLSYDEDGVAEDEDASHRVLVAYERRWATSPSDTGATIETGDHFLALARSVRGGGRVGVVRGYAVLRLERSGRHQPR